MKTIVTTCLAVLLLALAGCDDSDGGGGSTLARCNSWCSRHNADEDCGADFSCAGTCASFEINYKAHCSIEYESLLTCYQSQSDLCPAGGSQPCATENLLLVQCANSQGGDAGP